MPTLARPETEPSPTSGRKHPAVLAVGSALLLWLAFPPAEAAYLAWVALVPLFLLVRDARPARSLYLGAWAGGLVFWFLAVEWVRRTDPSAWLAWVVLAVFLSLWWPAFLWLARSAVHKLKLPLMIAAPVSWVTLEYARAHVLTGLPWYYLAHSQYRVLPLIQVADFAGAWALSFVLAMSNAWAADLLAQPLARPSAAGPRFPLAQRVRLVAMASTLLALVGYGLARLNSAGFRDGPRIGLLQSNFEQSLKMSLETDEIVAVYHRLAGTAVKEKPDLIVWPETSYPRGYSAIDPKLDDPGFERLIKPMDPNWTAAMWRQQKVGPIKAEIQDWVDAYGVPMIVGALTYDFRPTGLTKYNAALLFGAGSTVVQRYDKTHLVPFGEYVPLLETFPFLTRLTPFRDGHVPSLSPGTEPTAFTLGRYRLATAICFEDTLPHLVRRSFDGASQPDVLLNLSNDGWFQGSSEHDMHLAISVFRAVENRVPLARAANMGITAIVDGNGAIRRALAKKSEGVLVETVPLDDRRGQYSRWGDWFAQTCLALSIGWLVLAYLGLRRGIRRGKSGATEV